MTGLPVGAVGALWVPGFDHSEAVVGHPILLAEKSALAPVRAVTTTRDRDPQHELSC